MFLDTFFEHFACHKNTYDVVHAFLAIEECEGQQAAQHASLHDMHTPYIIQRHWQLRGPKPFLRFIGAHLACRNQCDALDPVDAISWTEAADLLSPHGNEKNRDER